MTSRPTATSRPLHWRLATRLHRRLAARLHRRLAAHLRLELPARLRLQGLAARLHRRLAARLHRRLAVRLRPGLVKASLPRTPAIDYTNSGEQVGLHLGLVFFATPPRRV